MAPKRRPGSTAKAVVTAKKVVEETVQVVVTPDGDDAETVELLSSSTKQDVKSIPVQYEDDETQPASEPETAPTPPRPEPPHPKPPAEKQPPKTKNKKTQARGETRKRRRSGGGYTRYLYRVMKQLHPDIGISRKAMTIINNLMGDMFERVAKEAARLQKYMGRQTMTAREVQGAVKLVLPGELGRHAICRGEQGCE